MSVLQLNFDGKNKIEVAIERIKNFEPPEGYYLAFSGGKDSISLLNLAVTAEVKFDAHYSPTTIDPPELVRFIRRNYPQVHFEKVRKSIFENILTRGLPIAQKKWCCAEYKEQHGNGRIVLTGIRWAESSRRSARQMVEPCYKTSKRYVHPMIDWDNQEIWEYIRFTELEYCSLYDEGFKRIGCVLCPNQSYEHKQRDIKRWPDIARRLRKATNKLYDKRVAEGKESVKRWPDGDAMFDWWTGRESSVKLDTDGELFAFD